MKAKCWALVYEGHVRAVDMYEDELMIANAADFSNRGEVRRAEVVVR